MPFKRGLNSKKTMLQTLSDKQEAVFCLRFKKNAHYGFLSSKEISKLKSYL